MNTFIIPETLSGKFVTLEQLSPSHREELRLTAADPTQFQYFRYLGGGSYFDKQFDNALSELARNERFAFAVRQNKDGKIVGSTSYYDVFPKYQRLAIGHTWYSAQARGTAVNPECKYLLFSYAFETLNYARIEIHTDTRNMHSRAAVKKLGAVEEGILRSHIPMEAENYRRDTVIYSILCNEWPQVKENLQHRLQKFETI
jgi:N-acetyltransferase